MSIDIVSPEEYVGDVISDLNARRGRVLGFEETHEYKIIKGTVPLAETFGYATHLRSAARVGPPSRWKLETSLRCLSPRAKK